MGDSNRDLWRYLEPWAAREYEEALLAPFVAPGDLCFLVGAAGVGKTHLASSIVNGFVVPELRNVVAGGALVPNLEIFGDYRVAIVDGDNFPARWELLVRRYLQGAGVELKQCGGRLIHADAKVLKLDVPAPNYANIRRGVESLHELRVRVIIIDSLLTVFRPKEIKEVAWTLERLEPFRAACREFGIAAIVLCHPARAQHGQAESSKLPLGISSQEAIADTVLYVRRLGAKEQTGISITNMKSRCAPWIRIGSSVNLYFRGNSHYECKDARKHWPLEPDWDDAAAVTLTPKQQEVLAALREFGTEGASASEVAAKLGSTADTVGDHLTALKRKGLARSDGAARNTRWYAVDEEGAKS